MFLMKKQLDTKSALPEIVIALENVHSYSTSLCKQTIICMTSAFFSNKAIGCIYSLKLKGIFYFVL